MPKESDSPQVSPQKKTAGGVPAVFSSFKHILSEMNVVRGTQTLLRLNQTDGFDCPGCAWPDPDKERSITEFCENGAKAVAEEATTRKVTPEFFARHSIPKLLLQTDFWLGKQGRLTHPLLKRPDSSHYEPVSWEAAFEVIAEELNSLQSPDEATFYTSGRTSNEAAFLYQLFVRSVGTNNLPDCSNMCHESSGVALNESLGIGKGSVTLEDFDHADCILVIGQNPGTNHPRMLTALQSAVRNGCKIISINPLQEAGLTRFKHPQEVTSLVGNGTPLACQHIPVRINGDVALLKGIMKELKAFEESRPGTVFDHAFIEKHTQGFAEFLTDLDQTSWDEIQGESGISREEMRNTAEVIAKSKRMIICWAMGLTQHKNAVGNIQEAVNLLLLGGHLGRKGAGACPVRGHSNVQGDRTMGIWEKMPDAFLDRLGAEFGFAPPRRHGMDTVDSIKGMDEGRIKLFFGMGGNFLSATPDTPFVAQALAKCRLTVHVSTKLNRSHLAPGQKALILPCLGRTERDLQNGEPQFVTVENSMGVVHLSQGALKPISPLLKSEVALVCDLAKVVFKQKVNQEPEQRSQVDWDGFRSNYDRIRDSISRVIPGFENYNSRVQNPGGFYLPHPVRDRLEFRTESGKAEFKVHPIVKTELPERHFLLMTIRSHDQFNTTIYGLDDRYRGIKNGRRVLFMNPEDMKSHALRERALVNITSHFQGITRTVEKFAVVPYAIPRKCVAAYFPETNPLVPVESTAEKSNTPTYKSIEVSLSEVQARSEPA